MKHPLLLIAISALVFSCGQPPHESENKAEPIMDSLLLDSAITQTETEDGNTNEIDLPSPLRIATTFKRSGLKFMEASMNPVDNAKNYNNSFSKALNLGVYSADMAYCLLNKQYSQSKNYLKTCKDLGSEIGLSSAFEANNLAQRFEKNIGKDDTLMKLVSDLQMQTDLVLEKNKQNHISVLLFTGAWLETLHSASQVYLKGETKMSSIILEQLSFAGVVIKALNQQKAKDENIAGLVSDIDAIYSEFNNIPEIKIIDINEADYSSLKISDLALKSLCEKIETLRDKIVKG